SQRDPVPTSAITHASAATILILLHIIVRNAPSASAAAWGDTMGTAAPPAANGRAARTTHATSAIAGVAEAASPNDTAASAAAGAIPRRTNRCRSRCRAD